MVPRLTRVRASRQAAAEAGTTLPLDVITLLREMLVEVAQPQSQIYMLRMFRQVRGAG